MSQRANSWALHHALLRPVVLQILRAAGYHAAKHSVVDTLTEITARYIVLLGQTTSDLAHTNNEDGLPTLTDARLALEECAAFIPSRTVADDRWRERLRRPLESYPERHDLRGKEAAKRDAEDTADIRAWQAWFSGPEMQEIARITGHQKQAVEDSGQPERGTDDYLSALKKKHSKTGEESRFQGTVIGKHAEEKSLRIEGGELGHLQDWVRYARERSMQLHSAQENGVDHGSDDLTIQGDMMEE